MHAITARAAALGLAVRGVLHPAPQDGVAAGTLVLLGLVPGLGWDAFAASAEAGDGVADPLDRWSRRLIDGLAAACAATALYPFGGPPWWPFQRWARQAEAVWPSPLGILIHPRWGLWHSYRGALALAARLDLPDRPAAAPPCADCAARPCLTACPVGAFRDGGPANIQPANTQPAGTQPVGTQYDVAGCAAHVGGPDGAACRSGGCLARRACPVGQAHTYGAAQAAFHMTGFLAARR